MPSAGFRFADRDDVPAVVQLVEAAYRGERSRQGWCSEADLLEGQRVDADMVSAALDTPGVRILVLADGGSSAACCELRRPDGPGPATLGMFAVDPGRQDRGLGRRVLAEAERIVGDDWGVDRLQLTVIDLRSELIDWYGRRGYRRTGEYQPFPYGDERFGVPLRDDLRFAVLEKRLGPSGQPPTSAA